jgi:hypothetical protein
MLIKVGRSFFLLAIVKKKDLVSLQGLPSLVTNYFTTFNFPCISV